MTLPPKSASFSSWDEELGAAAATGCRIAEQRRVDRTRRSRSAAQRPGSSSPTWRASTTTTSPSTGGEIRLRVYTPAGDGPASRVPPHPRRRLRRSARSTGSTTLQVRAHLRERRLRRRDRRVPPRTGVPVPDRAGGLLRGAALARRARRRARTSTRRGSPSVASRPAATSPPSSR